MWNKEYLLRKRSHFKKLLKRCHDPKEYEKLTEALYSTEYILDFLYSKDIGQVSESFKENMMYEDTIKNEYGILLPYVHDFSEKYVNDEFFSYQDLRHVYTDRNKILDLTSEFYNTLDKRFSKPFNRIFDKRNQWVKYVTPTEDSDICYTFPIYHSNIFLMLLNHFNNIEDFFSASHEYGHAIDVSYNQANIELIERIPFDEVVSIFMEMIDSLYIEDKGYSPKEILYARVNSFTKYLESAIIINEKNNILNMFNDKKIMSKKQATNYLRDKSHMEDFGIYQVLNESISDHLPYVVSYLLAVELFLIYLEDKEEAMNIVYKFIKLKDCTVGDYLDFFKKSGVEMGKNTSEYVKILKYKKDVLDDGKRFSN